MPKMKTASRALAIAVPLFVLAACSDTNNTVVNGLDCGLVRQDLIASTGTWAVTLGGSAVTLGNCTGLSTSPNGTPITTTDFPAIYSPVDIFGANGSTSYQVQSDRSDLGNDAGQNPELTGSVQADSCLAMARVWDKTDKVFIQCIGTLNRANLTISGGCDSAEIDTDANGQLDTSCSLSGNIGFNASIQ